MRYMTSEGRLLEVMDPTLQGVPLGDAEYIIETALKCVENNALKRPKMSQIVHILESEDPSLVSLTHPFFQR